MDNNIMESTFVFNGQQMQLKDIILYIRIGDIIEGVTNLITANKILNIINLHNNANMSYLLDKPDRFILFQ